jgi:hypothetical protein
MPLSIKLRQKGRRFQGFLHFRVLVAFKAVQPQCERGIVIHAGGERIRLLEHYADKAAQRLTVR